MTEPYLIVKTETTEARYECELLVSMGRDSGNTIILTDPLASRNHAMIRCLGKSKYYYMDTGSRNGSYINNRRISTPTLLKNEDKVTIGSTDITFYQEKEATNVTTNSEFETDLGETISSVRSDIRPVTILVADIRGYTTLSERIAINTLSKLMTSWFNNVQSVIENHGGIVDKFIGDCVMAVWETERDAKMTLNNCLKAALDIHNLTTGISKDYEDIPNILRIGVGINTGLAAMGIGTDNTAMGDAVNLAFRLETASKNLNSDLVLSQSSYQYLPKPLWENEQQEINVKGKTTSIKVCSLMFTTISDYLKDK
ncbi:adenylate/guanylate cyclase domain-containing protein [bacterium AH-315-E10]|nr:adenylate/guanylate cyclase domain-containing protein [bacterium AH-315-E10]